MCVGWWSPVFLACVCDGGPLLHAWCARVFPGDEPLRVPIIDGDKWAFVPLLMCPGRSERQVFNVVSVRWSGSGWRGWPWCLVWAKGVPELLSLAVLHFLVVFRACSSMLRRAPPWQLVLLLFLLLLLSRVFSSASPNPCMCCRRCLQREWW
jgi:hypothetical protein